MGKIKKISKYAPSLFQAKLNFSGTRSNISLTLQHPFEVTIMRGLLMLLAILCFGYLYFVGASVLNIIARKEASTETIRLQTSIAVLEADYFALSHEVDETIASSIGLMPLQKTQYVYRPGQSVAATIGANGI